MLGIVLVDSTPENYKEAFLPIMSPEFQEAYYKQFVHESSYEEFMFSLGEADKYCQLTRDIPLVVLVAGKKLLFARCTNKMVTIARRIITIIKQK